MLDIIRYKLAVVIKFVINSETRSDRKVNDLCKCIDSAVMII